MSYRYRKSINLGGGVRLNLSKGGVGWSVGGKGYRYTHSPRGYDRRTLSVPGTGLSHVTQKSRSPRATGGSRRDTEVYFQSFEQQAPKPPSPGLLASRYEKEFAGGVQHLQAQEMQFALEAFERASIADDGNKAQADDLMVGLLRAQLGQVEQAIPALEKVVSSEVALPDALIAKYLAGFTMSVTYAADVVAALPLDSVTAGVVLAECYRKHGRLDEAIGLLQKLDTEHPDPHFVLALCELYQEIGADDELLDAVKDAKIEHSPWLLQLMIRSFEARVMIEQGHDVEAMHLIADTYMAWYDAEQDLSVLVGLGKYMWAGEQWQAIIQLVTGYEITNSGDDGFRLKLLEAQAMERKGLDEAALAIYKELLKSKPRDPTKFATTVAQIEREQRQRDPELLKEARYLRGRLYLAMGKHAMGNRDLSAVYAEDPNYKDVAQLLEA